MPTSRLPLAAVIAATCLLVTTACTAAPAPSPTPSPTPSESSSATTGTMTGTLTFANGSLPPPGHYELDLEVTADEFTLTWYGYDDEVGHVSGVPIDLPGALTILDESGLLAGDDDTGGCDGGASARLDLEVDGQRIRSEAGTCGGEGGAGDVRAAIEAIAGADAVSGAVEDVKASS
ncbi:hypothetical protein SAMN05216410_2755 [Sanguibacter gelidistatuariae]|uniref:Uncharacterized protein n=1 Tax=Sanguibacter gelidistatuariae TaxID=1814289 RepID=A0A1G6RRY1_9MICO|nr:hypothetical protein [Sanguibacter gelidistatuariae]SDD07124.1 hypothetical protein SAMN05216410_2755 [Sanguibacter gelidistatuariae]